MTYNKNMIERSTHYVSDVQEYMEMVGHASVAEILAHLKQRHPLLSATTVHRITSRLLERGRLAVAPATRGSVRRFDTTTRPHDHFMCSHCDLLRDAQLADELRPVIERAVGDGCRISGNLVVTGICKQCTKEEL